MKKSDLKIGYIYMCNAIEIQRALKLTDVLDGWLYLEDLNGFKFALSEEHIFLIQPL